MRRSILSAWKASGLSPLTEHPPYTREKAEELKNEAIEMGVFPNARRRVVHLTGVLTDKEQLKDIEELIAKRGKIKGKEYSYRRSVMTALGAKVKEYIVSKSLADVGDYGYLDDIDPVSMMSDAIAAVNEEQGTKPGNVIKRCRGRPKKQLTLNSFNTGVILTWLEKLKPEEVTNLDVSKNVEQV